MVSAVVTASVELPGVAVPDAFAAMVDPAAQERWMIATRLYPVQAQVPVPAVGSRVAAFTGVGGFGFLDTMTVTAYEPPHRWVVGKDGDLLRGVGIMQVTPTPEGCRATWTNELTPPFGLLGRVGFLLVRPIVELALLACLRRLARLLRTGQLPLDHQLPGVERSVLR
jgi:uncharacterized protein YndB with AHSA1/START domain